MRLFAALDLDERAREAIGREQRQLAATLGGDRRALAWVRPDQMHVTLAFVGELADAQAPSVVAALAADIAVPPFTAVFDRVGVFPPRGDPRVLWLGVGEGAPAIARVQRETAARFGAAGVTLEDRPFHAHVTLARCRRAHRRDVARVLEGWAPRAIASVRVDHVTVYQSRLSPSGATYTVLARATLT